jgi:hypothetical protein
MGVGRIELATPRERRRIEVPVRAADARERTSLQQRPLAPARTNSYRTRPITAPASIALVVSRLLQGRLDVTAKDCILKGRSMLRPAVNTIALGPIGVARSRSCWRLSKAVRVAVVNMLLSVYFGAVRTSF